jgi:transposase
MKILVGIEPQDFRKGIDGLARICKEQLKENPFEGTVFVFRNRSKTAIKILVYDGQGFWLCQKRLSSGRFRWWPKSSSHKIELKTHELHVLFNGGNPEKSGAANYWRPLKTISS